jgi:hypothetical protein
MRKRKQVKPVSLFPLDPEAAIKAVFQASTDGLKKKEADMKKRTKSRGKKKKK